MKIQIRLRIRAVWSESSLGTFWIAKDVNFLIEDSADAKADLSLHWALISEGTFSDVSAHLLMKLNKTDHFDVSSLKLLHI